MKKNIFFINLCFFIFLAPLGAFAVTDSSDTNVQINVSGCNNNALCEAHLGEDFASCPIDCAPIVPPATTTPPGGGGGGPTVNKLEFYDLVVNVSHNDAEVSWKTRTNALTTFSWGLSYDYDEGSVSEIHFVKNHQVKIENLKPLTRYYYKIEGRDAQGAEGIFEGTFITKSLPDLTPPSNVTNLTLTQYETKNLLKWVNPTDDDFAFVRILRSTKTYPYDVLSGRIIYEGSGNYVYDDYTDPNVIYYYTVFASDYSGNFSSGATIKSTLKSPGQSATTTSPLSNPFKDITLRDFDFIQLNQHISYIENTIPVNGDEYLTVSLLSKKLNIKPHILLLEITRGDEQQTLLLREYINKNAYETIVNLKGETGQYTFSIYFLNEKLESVHRLDGTFVVYSNKEKSSSFLLQKINNFINNHPNIVTLIIVFILALFLLIILLIMWIIQRRKRAILLVPNESAEITKKE